MPVWGPLLAWAVLVGLGSFLVYDALVAPGIARLNAAPLLGALDPKVQAWVVLPIVVAGLVVIGGLRCARTLSWRPLLLAGWSTAVVWSVSLAATRRGWGRITSQLERPGEYLAAIPGIDSLGSFLDGFVEKIASFPTHVEGHPPGFLVLVWALRQVDLGGTVPVSVLCVLVGAAAVPAALVTVRAVAGEAWARRAAPFAAISPAAIWIATSADAFYTGVAATAVALVVVATGRTDRRGDAYALGGGFLFGITAFLSYGLVLLAVVPLVVAASRRRARPIGLALIGSLPVFLVFLAAGFWWVGGLFATRARYLAGISSRRPYEVYVLANLSSFAIGLGPAIAVALWRLRDRRMWLVVGSVLLAVAMADVSGMSKAEVERIWLPFMPLVLVSGAVLVVPRRSWRRGAPRLSGGAGWLAVQASVAILLETLVRTAW